MDPADVLSGASDISTYHTCREMGAALYVSGRLHFSLYSIGLSTAIVSTSEATEAGMGPGGYWTCRLRWSGCMPATACS